MFRICSFVAVPRGPRRICGRSRRCSPRPQSLRLQSKHKLRPLLEARRPVWQALCSPTQQQDASKRRPNMRRTMSAIPLLFRAPALSCRVPSMGAAALVAGRSTARMLTTAAACALVAAQVLRTAGWTP